MTLGDHGGTALTKFTGGGLTWRPGSHIPAEVARDWPVGNRHALESVGRVQWLRAPSQGIPEDDVVAALAQHVTGARQRNAVLEALGLPTEQ